MELINKTDANLNIALIAKNKAKSDAQKALMGRVLFMMDNMPTIEAIPKDQYEARLKNDMVDMLVRLNNEIDDLRAYDDIETVDKCEEIIQKKINEIEGNEDGND